MFSRLRSQIEVFIDGKQILFENLDLFDSPLASISDVSSANTILILFSIKKFNQTPGKRNLTIFIFINIRK